MKSISVKKSDIKRIWNGIWKYLVVGIVGLFIGFMINIPSCNKQETIIKIPVHDTITVTLSRILERTIVLYIDRIDTFYISELDTIYLSNIPIDHKKYSDTITTDSTSTEIDILYHGFSSGIDSIYLKHNYYKLREIIPELKKRISPYIFVEGGPMINTTFTRINGVQVGFGAGIYIKDSWGLGASYNFNTNLDHTIKIQINRKF